jgi:hypothetical protein
MLENISIRVRRSVGTVNDACEGVWYRTPTKYNAVVTSSGAVERTPSPPLVVSYISVTSRLTPYHFKRGSDVRHYPKVRVTASDTAALRRPNFAVELQFGRPNFPVPCPNWFSTAGWWVTKGTTGRKTLFSDMAIRRRRRRRRRMPTECLPNAYRMTTE